MILSCASIDIDDFKGFRLMLELGNKEKPKL
jgi:hypothetical protein